MYCALMDEYLLGGLLVADHPNPVTTYAALLVQYPFPIPLSRLDQPTVVFDISWIPFLDSGLGSRVLGLLSLEHSEITF
jgi:hypothetical protein